MKKSVLLAILGVSAGVASSYGQGFVALDNYSSAVSPLITYGPSGGGNLGAGITGSAWHVGVYFADSVSFTLSTDANGIAVPSSLDARLVLGTGAGSVANIVAPGIFTTAASFQGSSAVAGGASTFMVIAYNGGDYATSGIRGHSAAFVMTALVGTSFPPFLGDGMNAFQVNAVPEPSTLALIGLGTGALLFFRRRK